PPRGRQSVRPRGPLAAHRRNSLPRAAAAHVARRRPRISGASSLVIAKQAVYIEGVTELRAYSSEETPVTNSRPGEFVTRTARSSARDGLLKRIITTFLFITFLAGLSGIVLLILNAAG
ncbi:MAG: hypothetical protein ACOC45_07585, partial [Alkalispirochaetaceae bacterium]